MSKLTALELEIAVMQKLGVRQNIIVPNVSWGIAGLHECDILSLSPSGYATEIEIKVSKSDLLMDRHKMHGHIHNHIKYLFFAVPLHLQAVALENIPDRAGLVVVEKKLVHGIHGRNFRYQTNTVKPPVPNKNCWKWTEKERFQLTRLGTMRILRLNKNLIKERRKNELLNE